MSRKRQGHYTSGPSGPKTKVRYTEDAAGAAAERINEEQGHGLAAAYVCNWCAAWHVGRGKKPSELYAERITIHRWDAMMIEVGRRALGCLAVENAASFPKKEMVIRQRCEVFEKRRWQSEPSIKRGSIKGI